MLLKKAQSFALSVLMALVVSRGANETSMPAISREGVDNNMAQKEFSSTVICKQPGRYIGWPTIAKTAGDELLVVFSGDRDEHVCPYGKTQMVRSRDEGRTWSAPATITDSPIDDRDAGILVLKSGAILVNWFTSLSFEKESQVSWIPQKTRDAWKPYITRLTQEDRDKHLGSWVRRSTDDGKSWGEWIRTPVNSPHGPIQLHNGRLLFLGRGRSTDGKVIIGAAESRDEGRSWQLIWSKELQTKEQQENFQEPYAVELSDGRLIGLFRFETRGGEYLWQTESDDGGRTWSVPHPTPIWGYPPHLLLLRDGQLLCTYGYRKAPYGQRACFSYDGGRTWDIEHEVIFRADAPNDDLGYPASVQLKDGSILSVYYQIDKAGEKTCLMATRWAAPMKPQTIRNTQLELGEPVTVSMSQPEFAAWGPWQFPGLARLPDGNIQISYHIHEDSATAYGKAPGRSISGDNGKTWTPVPDENDDKDGAKASWASAPVVLANGDRITVRQLRPQKTSDLRLPEKPFATYKSYGAEVDIYRVQDLPPECAAGWEIYRMSKDSGKWAREKVKVNLPGETRGTREGVMGFPWFHHMYAAPDKSAWAVNHCRRIVNGAFQDKTEVIILRSTDQGKTWNLHGVIPYSPDPSADSKADQRDGFTEPEVNFMPDGSVLCLIRTTDGNGPGPMYWSRSTDNGKTWTKPAVFDDIGVWPQMLTLRNGVTLAVYGRPGLFVRATTDPAGLKWDPRGPLLPPGPLTQDTCSYAALLALNDDTALVAYSDFRVRDSDWVKHKAIRVRTIRATRNEIKGGQSNMNVQAANITSTQQLMRVELGQPAVVTISPPKYGKDPAGKWWGFYQFPDLWQGSNGTFFIAVNVGADSTVGEHEPTLFFSSRNGNAWKKASLKDMDLSRQPIRLPDGSEVTFGEQRYLHPVHSLTSAVQTKLSAKKLGLKPISGLVLSPYKVTENVYYDYKTVPESLRRFPVAWRRSSDAPWQMSSGTIDMPDLILSASARDGWWDKTGKFKWTEKDHEFTLPIPKNLETIVTLPDNTLLWALTSQNPKVMDRCCGRCGQVTCLESKDHGQTWHRRGFIANDTAPTWGYTSELALTRMPDDDLLCVMRTKNSNESTDTHYLAAARSTDNGFTWSTPVPVAQFSVTPHLLCLKNGTVALIYGRPGVHVKISTDSGQTWSESVPLVGPSEKELLAMPLEQWWRIRHDFSCANTSVVVTGPDSFLVAYSDFRYKDEAGQTCKAIKVQEITVVPDRR